MSPKVEAIATRAAWTFAMAFASVVAVLSPTGLWHLSTLNAAAGSGVIALASAIKNGLFTPPEAK